MKRALLCTLLILLPIEATAARVFLTGFEYCDYNAGDELFILEADSWSNPIITATSPTPRGNFCDYVSHDDRGKACSSNADCNAGQGTCVSEPNNGCSLEVSPTTSVEWARVGTDIISATDTLYTHLLVNVTTVGDSGDPLKLLTYKQGSNVGMFLRLERASSTEYQARLYFEDDGKECAGGTNDGTEATSDADCTAETPGESTASDSSFASTPVLRTGQWYEITIGQDNTAGAGGDVRGELWESGFNRGAQTRPQGACTGDGFACSSNADCPSRCSDWVISGDPEGDDTCATNADCSVTCDSQTCSTADVGQVTDILIGQEAATTSVWQVNIDDLIIDDAVAVKTARIARMTPDGEVEANLARTGCSSSRWECIDDLATGKSGLDYSTTYLSRNGNPNNDIFTLSDITLAAGESISTSAGVAFSGLYNDHGDAASGKYHRLCAHDGTNRSCWGGICTTNADCNNAQECNSGLCYSDIAYHSTGGVFLPDAYALITDPPGADTQWCRAPSCSGFDLNSLDVEVGTASNAFHLTAVVAEAEVSLQSPTLPGVAVDVNGDGYETLCVAGDSTANQTEFHNLLTASLEDFDSIIVCTRGSTTIGDIEQNIETIMNGRSCSSNADCSGQTPTCGSGLCSPNYMQCRTLIGGNHKCDYLLLVSGVNTLVAEMPPPRMHCNGGTDQGDLCSTNADCTGGMCESYEFGYCRGGTDHGAPCYCGQNGLWVNDTSGYPDSATRYCINNKASHWLATNVSSTCRTCSDKYDCRTNIACTTNADCGDECDGGECVTSCTGGQCDQAIGYVYWYLDKPTRWWTSGCINAPGCSGGLCMTGNSIAEYERSLRAIVAAAAARPVGSEVELILAPQPSSIAGVACATNADCPPEISCSSGLCFGGVTQPFTLHSARITTIATLDRQTAINDGLHYVDLHHYFNTKCAGVLGDYNRANCFRDHIHWNNFDLETGGVKYAVDLIEACLENLSGTSDGVCSGGVCTSGRTQRTCATNTDCNFYDCAL